MSPCESLWLTTNLLAPNPPLSADPLHQGHHADSEGCRHQRGGEAHLPGVRQRPQGELRTRVKGLSGGMTQGKHGGHTWMMGISLATDTPGVWDQDS